MALPSKGIRKVTVSTIKYYWTVKVDYQMMKMVVGIGKVLSPNQHVSLFCKFEDPWLAFPEKVDNEAPNVTPRLIRKAIVYANSNEEIEWNGKKASLFELTNGDFTPNPGRISNPD